MTPGGALARALRWIGAAAVLVFLVAAFTPLTNVAARALATPARLEPADAIVVLGGGLYPDASLPASSFRRTVHGIALHRQALAPVLVLLGGPEYSTGDEAASRASLARAMGIPDQAILVARGATTTREEARDIARLLGPRGARRILLVTGSHHMARAQRVFEQAGFVVLPAPADALSLAAKAPGDRLKLGRQVLQEVVGRLYYRAAGYF